MRGWVPAAMVLAPVGLLLAADRVHPLYMNARHLSLIGGAYIVLVAGGLGLIWRYQRWAAGALALLLVCGTGYSTTNYFFGHEYQKDDFSGLKDYLTTRSTAGDVVLLQPPFAWRQFAYYLPVGAWDAAATAGAQIAHYGVPALNHTWDQRYSQLDIWRHDYRRIWLIVSNTYPFADPAGNTEQWLGQHMFEVHDVDFYSHSSLKAHLYLPEVPVYDRAPLRIPHPVDVVFGDQMRLIGYDVGRPYVPGLGVAAVFYWQITKPTTVHYKYIFKLEKSDSNGQNQTIALTEREPYEGAIPTIYSETGPDGYRVQ